MSIFQRLTNNLVLKVFSLALAILLSFYVLEYVNPLWTDDLPLSLRIDNLAMSLIVVEPIPLQAGPQIKVKGPVRTVRRMEGVNLTAALDCSTITDQGVYNLPVKLPDLGDLQIIEQEYKFVQIKIEEKASVSLSIGVNRRGTVDENFEVGEEQISQPEVVITGPRSLIDRIDVAQIEPEVKHLRHDIRNQIMPVQLYDKNYELIAAPSLQIRPGQVSYSLKLISIGSIRVLKVIPDYTGQLPEDYMLDKLVPIPLTIPVDANLVPEGVFAVRTTPIDLTDAREKFTVETQLIYPFEVPEISRLPDLCQVTVHVISIAEIGAARVAVDIIGASSDYDYVVTPPEIVVRSEELMLLDVAEVDQIQAVLYVADLGPGEYRLAPQLTLPLTIERVTIDHDTLELTIIQSGD